MKFETFFATIVVAISVVIFAFLFPKDFDDQNLFIQIPKISTENAIFEVGAMLPANVSYICNLEPFSHSAKDVSSRFEEVLSELIIFPLEEYEAYFVYIGDDKTLIGSDRFYGQQKVRWNYAEHENLFGCEKVSSVELEIDHTKSNKFVAVSLKSPKK